MSNPTKSLASRILSAQLAINNSLDNVSVLDAIKEYSYDETRLNRAKELLSEVEHLRMEQKRVRSEQHDAGSLLKIKRAAADKYYKRLVKIGRISFNDDKGSLEKLSLLGRRKQSFSGWLVQTMQFYNNLLDSKHMMEKMAYYGMTREKIEEGKTLVEAAKEINYLHKQKMGESRQITKELNQKASNLDKWLHDFRIIAKMALEPKPKLLKMLGI